MSEVHPVLRLDAEQPVLITAVPYHTPVPRGFASACVCPNHNSIAVNRIVKRYWPQQLL